MTQELEWDWDPNWRYTYTEMSRARIGNTADGTWFELHAWHDGHWVVIGLRSSAGGSGEMNLANAKRRAQTVWEAMR